MPSPATMGIVPLKDRSWLHRLPSEIVEMIYSYLNVVSTLALDLYFIPQSDERVYISNYLQSHIPASALCIQQILQPAGAEGSYNWELYHACKDALYRNPVYHKVVGVQEESGKTTAPLNIGFEDAEEALSVWCCVQQLLDHFKQNFEWQVAAYDSESSAVIPDCFTNPNNIELGRLVLAVYQFNAYCYLLGGSEDDMTFQEAATIAKQFFHNLTPWEKEALFCVAKGFDYRAHLTTKELIELDRDTIVLPYLQWEIRRMIKSNAKRTKPHQVHPDRGAHVQHETHRRTVCFSPTTILVKSIYGLDLPATTKQRTKQRSQHARPVPWSVALETFLELEYDNDSSEAEHPYAAIYGLDPSQARLQEPDIYDWFINRMNDLDPDVGPMVAWELLHDDAKVPHVVGQKTNDSMHRVGYPFWTLDREVLYWPIIVWI